ncbi:virulence RhuM family protein [Aquiflexum lacus]|uniref:virulence RhuM family protein n=1 Tax=Aquiflexum lacus TaxID=2483805 RepID=UPI001E4E47AE|nr:RhuM family protein [Aquiflexum lacus]
MNSDILIYQNPDGNIKIDVRLKEETVWLTQAQMGLLFGKDKRTISEHLGNVFQEGELDKSSTVRKFRIVQLEGSREVEREIDHYNLDVIISVGYRVKSPQETQSRIWATQRKAS